MPVGDELAGSRDRRGEAGPEDDVVQTPLEELQPRRLGIASPQGCPFNVPAELALGDPVVITDRLLLFEPLSELTLAT
jgi:hypothetical protein